MPVPSKVVTDSIQAVSIRYNNLVYDMKRRGIRVIVLSLGEAYFDVPLHPMDDLPFPTGYHYSHSRGIFELREKVGQYYRRFDVPVEVEKEIVVTAGSKAAIHFALMSTLDPGDEAIIHEPTWVSYPEQVKLCHAKPVLIPYDRTVQDYERYVTGKSKVVIVNNPHNPRGQVFTERELRYLVDLCRANDLWLLADEAYSDFVVGEKFLSAGAIDPKKDHVIVCNSISKNFGISGWRLGYVIAQEALISQILKVNQHIVTCPATILAHYVARHWDEILETCKPQIADLVRRRAELGARMDRMGLTYLPGTATFYFFVSIAPSRLTSEEFCTRLLVEDHVSTVPGSGYGASCDRFIRVSVGTESMDDIQHGLDRIQALIGKTSG